MSLKFPVVGVAASAGGLDALLALFSQLDKTACWSFIIAQHMAKEAHCELVQQLIARESLWPVVVPYETTTIVSGVIYLLPASQNGYVVQDQIKLVAPDEHSYSSPSANLLFHSMAQALKEKAVGVILSGAGSDGAEGLCAIANAGGQTFAQHPSEAKYASMPESAIAKHCIQHVRPLHDIALTLSQRLISSAQKTSVSAPDLDRPTSEIETLSALLQQVYQCTTLDFSGYKADTLLRRLDKRRQALGLDQLQDYQAYVQQQPNEVAQLIPLLLVSVSSFFRDPEVFELIKLRLQCLATDSYQNPARILVAGCATGEEAYSFAMLWRSFNCARPLEILAIDLNAQALQQAEQAQYSDLSLNNIPPKLRTQYVEPRPDGGQLSPDICRMVQFKHADLLTSRLPEQYDFISCRNLMIYLKKEQQDALISRLHQALKPEGDLLIGLTESLSPETQPLFRSLHHYYRLFQRY